ncbi:glycosyltransferase family 2 protein [Flagellimonas onchidii]|uniref:glycosyltransferase family 2 protein n=1 Tax=Flagellimonas onchidii TaxID=2562684 RepID=UPI0010A61B4A|nr:glycosyltransferase [Allomuricauda onchidii]
MDKQKKYKISFYIVCMNRLDHLKQTLHKNIEDNISYGNVEFILLNYNSKDGLDEWVQSEMSHLIKKGTLKYFKTEEPKYFLRSHSRNVVAKQTTGDIICNVDADNFIGKGFADYVNAQFHKDDNIFLSVNKNGNIKDCYGRICMKRKDFMKLGGYDESMKNYGFEDFDLVNRLKLLGLKNQFIDNKEFLTALNHDDDIRLENEYNSSGIQKIYLRYITPSVSELVFHFMDNRVYWGKIVDNRTHNSESIENLFPENRKFEYEYNLMANKWEIGNYSADGNTLFKNFCVEGIKKNPDYVKITEQKDFMSMVMFFSQIGNRIKMKQNLIEKRIQVNGESFGEGKVVQYKHV